MYKSSHLKRINKREFRKESFAKYSATLKLASIFYQMFIFSSNDSTSKTMKNVFISSKKLFSFSRYSDFSNFSTSFSNLPDSKRQWEVE